MAIYFQHVEGSKKGQVETFDADRIRVGRRTNNDLRFELNKDREVSVDHLKTLFFTFKGWSKQSTAYVKVLRTNYHAG